MCSGPRSRLLVTTRDADLLVALGARELPLDVLSEELALELLSSWSGHARALSCPPRRAGSPKAAAICLWRWRSPERASHGGARWEDVLSALERGRLEFLDHPYGSVFSSLRLSTDALPESERDRYFELAVFPEDADIPVEAICTLWRHTGAMEPDASRDLLRRLHRRALLTRHEDGSGISFHDLQHDFLRLNIASLVEGHAALVDAYRAAAPSGWASGPDDGYFFQHLPQHLAAADRLDEVKALLCDYDWLAAKLRATNITACSPITIWSRMTRISTLIQQALRLSIPALVRDRSQLPGQLLGRLTWRRESGDQDFARGSGERAGPGVAVSAICLADAARRTAPPDPGRTHGARSTQLRSSPTAAAPSPAPMTTRCGCGISRPARPCAPSKGTPAWGQRGGGAGRRQPRPLRLR